MNIAVPRFWPVGIIMVGIIERRKETRNPSRNCQQQRSHYLLGHVTDARRDASQNLQTGVGSQSIRCTLAGIRTHKFLCTKKLQ